ncbi:MAG: NADH:flavin oxidoreductase/NADH oxidase [Hyphomicrobiaceae bacterium]|nr:NADH:flavin oxidoreductase/NADH oxidase [Hyphomicrobiaceae bacterium]
MSQLFSEFTLRGLTLRNRTVVSPMCQFASQMGLLDDWHLVHLGRFAVGGFGLVYVEATAVTPEGRITYADSGLWNDAHIPPLRRIVDFLHAHGAAAAIQLAHAGRKATTPHPWRKTDTADAKARAGFEDWQPVAPSALPHAEGHKVPHELSIGEIETLVQRFVEAAERALAAGFDIVEIHGAHGYLIDQFLSPLANKRTDKYGGSRENRMRFMLEVADGIRRVWPDEKPLFARLSVQDWHPDGWQIEDSVALAAELKSRGVDLIDCSSGGFAEGQVKGGALYQVPFAQAVRSGAAIPTMAVGLIDDANAADAVIANGQADLVAFGRPALEDPNWPVHAKRALEGTEGLYDLYAGPVGHAIRAMDKALGR